MRFSRLVVEQPWIREIDINPLLASPEGLLALDARVIAHASEPGTSGWPRPAIRPYPTQYVAPWTARSGATLLIRPIRPEDEPLLVQFHESLSERSVSLRYFHAIKLGQRVAHDRLTRICFIDYDREMALVAEGKDPVTGARRSSASAAWGSSTASTRPSSPSSSSTASRAMGLGTELLRRLIQVGRDEALERISAEILPENREMQHVCQKLGFRLSHQPADMVVKAVIDL